MNDAQLSGFRNRGDGAAQIFLEIFALGRDFLGHGLHAGLDLRVAFLTYGGLLQAFDAMLM